MNDYKIDITPRAVKDLDGIYNYIVETFKTPETAEMLLHDLEDVICSLNVMPYRGAIRKNGYYKEKEYRQLFVKNFTVVYRVDEFLKRVIILTVRYTPSSF